MGICFKDRGQKTKAKLVLKNFKRLKEGSRRRVLFL